MHLLCSIRIILGTFWGRRADLWAGLLLFWDTRQGLCIKRVVPLGQPRVAVSSHGWLLAGDRLSFLFLCQGIGPRWLQRNQRTVRNSLLTGCLLLQQQHYRSMEGVVGVPGARLGSVLGMGSAGCDSQLPLWQWWCAAPCEARQPQLLHLHSPHQGSYIPQHTTFWDHTSILSLQAGSMPSCHRGEHSPGTGSLQPDPVSV